MLKWSRAIFQILAVLLTVGSAMLARAQAATPVATLDLRKITGVWYEVARLPDKREKNCARDVTKLISLGDKARTIQIVDSCTTKRGYNNVSNAAAKQDKAGSGRLKTGYWPFTRKLWVLALAPDDSWAVVGSPNHKELLILAREATLDPAELDRLRSNAVAQGFRIGKLAATSQESQEDR